MTPQVKQLILMAENALQSEEAKERLKRNKVSFQPSKGDPVIRRNSEACCVFSKVMKKVDKLSLVCKTKEVDAKVGEREIEHGWEGFKDGKTSELSKGKGSSTRPFLNSQFFLPIYALVCSLYKARGT